ncbi:MAG: hypothetical protein JKY65_26560 [Planctomycetes bacterium]|nr:hypothetical protein [Planctomycetota bacterium]
MVYAEFEPNPPHDLAGHRKRRQVQGSLAAPTQGGMLAALEHLSRSSEGGERPAVNLEPLEGDGWEIHFSELVTADLPTFARGLVDLPGISVEELGVIVAEDDDS